jgi:lipopolysaccharide heptosyltransferase I
MADLDPPKRILMIRPSALGDVCRTVPVLASLRRAFPRPVTRIDWAVQEEFAPAITAHPDLDEIVPFPRRRLARWWRDPAAFRAMRCWFAALRARGYDRVYDCQGLGRSGLIAWATRAPRRIGFRSARELGWLGCNVRHTIPSGLHAVDHMLRLLAEDGIAPVRDLRLFVAEADGAWWREQAASLGLASAGYAVLAPTSRWRGKQWPVDRWIDLLPGLRSRGLHRVVVIGADGERDQVAALLESGRDLIDLIGRATIGQTMAVIQGASLVVANDSAPLHMAVGLGARCIGLFGPTDPARVGPYGHADAVVRGRPAAPARPLDFKNARQGEAMMRQIAVRDVLERIDHVLGSGRGAGTGGGCAAARAAAAPERAAT